MRLKRICSEDSSYEKQKDVLRSQLISRGYKEDIINREFRKVDQVEREEALRRKNRQKQNDRVPLVLTYSSHLPDIHNIVKSNMHILHKSDRMKKVFKKPSLVAYRRGANLADVLIHGKLNKMMSKEDRHKTIPCGEESCKVCSHVCTSRRFSSTNGDEYEILMGGNCNTRNVVYLLSCRRCENSVYVGETERALKQRVKEHLWDIRGNKEKPVAVHFNQAGHKLDDLQVQVIESVKDNSLYYRKIREEFWMNKLNTVTPFGLNVKSK